MSQQFQQEFQGRWPHMQHLEKHSKVVYDDTKQIELPEPCPICKGKVMLTGVPAMTEVDSHWKACEQCERT